MSNAHRRQARELFLDALEVPEGERQAFVEERCGGLDALREEVLSLLDSHQESDGFLEGPMHQTWSPAALQGQRIARYKIEQVLSVGGMGVVYRATQDSPQRQVALKLMRPSLFQDAMLTRFRYEGEILGRLQHPCIAQVYEAGHAEVQGVPQPFLAMELVDGKPLVSDSDRRSVAEWVSLMARVADGVHHAHQNGVIHRDLKPSNILVNREGDPKILDFGIARPIERDESQSLATETGQYLGTLPYMSPEQFEGAAAILDTRSDVYSLGVLLYRCLSGRLPFEVTGKPLPEAARLICDTETVPLGDRRAELRGDLSTITAKAMEKDPAARYDSAASLAADLRHFLEDEPIQARKPTLRYQWSKFARRNRVASVAIVGAVAALLLGSVGTSLGLWRALRAEERERTMREAAQESQQLAEKQARRATAARDFLEQMIQSPNPRVLSGQQYGSPDVKVIDVLRQYATTLRDRFADDPELEADLQDSMARFFGGLGQTEHAVRHWQRALELRRSLYGEHHELTYEARLDLVSTKQSQYREEEGQTELLALMPQLEAHLGPDHRLTLRAKYWLAVSLRLLSEYKQALELLAEIQGAGDVLAEMGPEWALAVQCEIALSEGSVGEQQHAEQLFREGLVQASEQLGDDHPVVWQYLDGLGQHLTGIARFEEANAVFRDLLGRLSGRLPPEHEEVAKVEQLLAMTSRSEEAGPLLEKLYQQDLARYGPLDPKTFETGASVVMHYYQRGDFATALKWSEELLLRAREVFEPDSELMQWKEMQYASLLARVGEAARAVPLLEKLLERARNNGMLEFDYGEQLLNQYTLALSRAGRPTEALPYAEQVYDRQCESLGIDSPATFFSLELWVLALETADDLEAAESRLLSHFDELDILHGVEHPLTQRVIQSIIAFYQRHGEAEKAREFQEL